MQSDKRDQNQLSLYKNSLENKELVEAAIAVRKHATPMLSGFDVGAALLGDNGLIYTGANHETFCGALTHAEHAAVTTALNAGVKAVSKAVIVAFAHETITPCGGCLQWLSVVMHADCQIICGNLRDGSLDKYRLKELLPACPKICNQDIHDTDRIVA